MKIVNGTAHMTQKEFNELDEKSMIMRTGKEELFLYHGYPNSIHLIHNNNADK
jgi:hypothetical protein